MGRASSEEKEEGKENRDKRGEKEKEKERKHWGKGGKTESRGEPGHGLFSITDKMELKQSRALQECQPTPSRSRSSCQSGRARESVKMARVQSRWSSKQEGEQQEETPHCWLAPGPAW